MPQKSKKQSRVSKSSQNPFTFSALCGNPRVLYGVMSPIEEQRQQNDLYKAARSDYGRPIDIRIPTGYHAQVRKSWEMYDSDRLFRYLIDRTVDFGANGFEWELPIEIKKHFWQVGKSKKLFVEADREKKVWSKWAASINQGVANVIPGIDEINKWILKHFQLASMAPLEWEYGTLEVDGVKYDMPMKMTMHNSLSIALDRSNQKFMEESIYLRISKAQKKILESNKLLNQISGVSIFGNGDWHGLKLMGEGNKSRQEAFALKYNWSPGDNTSLVSGKSVSVGQGLYPTPPFVGLYEILMLRRALCAADLAILDGIIHFIIDWSIGDSTTDGNGNLVNQPRPEKKDSSGNVIEKSSIELAKECITADNKGAVMQLFHPYYIKPNILMPDVNSLISADKYIQTLIEMFLAFGILVSPPRTRLDFADINMANFEQMLENMRKNHIKRFWEALCSEIVKRNHGKLSAVPNMIFNPLNTQDEKFRNGLLALAKIGKVSTDTLLKSFGVDKRVELRELTRELALGEKQIFDDSVPISFRQATVKGGKENVSSRTPLEDGGRPIKETQEESEEEDDEE